MRSFIRLPLFFLINIVLILSCQPDWDNPMETDSDMKDRPIIKEFTLTEDNNIQINLGRVYSDSVKFIAERNENGIYVPITPVRFNLFSLLDTSFDKESQHNFIYRYQIKKGKYLSEYCEPKSFQYPAEFIYPPDNFRQQTIELQGIRFYWHDRSRIEEHYVVEKDSGSGYQVIAELPSNTETYFDAMAGVFDPPAYLRYRIYAKHGSQQSAALEYETEYSGLGSPTNLQIADSSTWHFTIEWQDNSNIEDGYEVERSKNGANFQVVRKLSANSTTYTDFLNELGTFTYRVRAYKDLYYSGYSNEVEITITTLLPTEGMVAYYPFNGNAKDESGNGQDGSVYDVISTTDRFGKANKAYFFDKGAYIEIIPTEKLKITGNITIAVWINFKGGYYNPRVISLAPDKSGYEITSWGTSSSRNFYFAFGGNSVNTNNKLNEDVWYFLCGVCDENSIKIYINDKLDNENSITNKTFNFYTNINIGRRPVSAYDYWGGMIDDIRIYNRALSEEEILNLYHEGGWQ